ncbi:MAG: ATP-dependent RecD-like DNA helicase [Clostridiales bacterium]|nr:MAG: ATP-dependent RecD-like DNA helicase [Clostridiales bacterium]
MNLNTEMIFEFINSPNLEESARIMVDTYIRETSKYGIDNVALLTPFRKKTATGVNSINESVREIINPGASGITFRNQSYRHGDKVMQIKNHEDVNNGDIGYITDISKVGNDTTISIDFWQRKKIKEYDINDMDQIDLGYASTIHKSQGSEYKSVIINIQNAHYIMLNRPLIYTAITRSKEKVIIIGDKKSSAYGNLKVRNKSARDLPCYAAD